MRKHFETNSQGKVSDGRLIKQGLFYYVRYMNATDLRHSLKLQSHVVDILKKIGKPHYIIPKTEAHLRKLLVKGQAVIGTFVKNVDPAVEDRLAAHMLIVYPQILQDVGLSDNTVIPDKDLNKISIVSNILVHQDFRGNKLMQKMLGEWLKIAHKDNKSHALAEACIDNEFSWGVFLDCGFVIYASGHDPRDGSESVYLHKPLDHKFIYSSSPEDSRSLKLFNEEGEIDKSAHETLNKLLKSGFHVRAFDRKTRQLSISKCVGTAPLNNFHQSPPSHGNDNKPL